jgi:glutamine synthetase
MLAYSARNRSASIRIPYVSNPKGRRIEVRFPDSTANPYLAFAAMMMAGLDGIQNRIHPGDPMDKDMYDLPPEEEKLIPKVCFYFDEALSALDADREFLTKGGVFTNDLIDAYIGLKNAGSDPVADDHSSGRIRYVLQPLTLFYPATLLLIPGPPLWGRFYWWLRTNKVQKSAILIHYHVSSDRANNRAKPTSSKR